MKKVAILHNAVTHASSPDERDVLDQVTAVSQALTVLGVENLAIPFSLAVSKTRSALKRAAPSSVFNLVESVDGDGRLLPLAPALLDSWGFPYTGSSREALFLTTQKILAKSWLRKNGIPTPDWTSLSPGPLDSFDGSDRWIVKAVWEHASIGLDDGSLLKDPKREDLDALLHLKEERFKTPFFAERFVQGREFNVSLLCGEVLPIPEMVFRFPEGMARIVDYRAKWDEGSFAYKNTERSFASPPQDRTLKEEISRLARLCWEIFGLKGYARVDFRTDQDGRPWVLEVNANPCLSPDGGFAAALKEAGIPFFEAVRRILPDALPPKEPSR